MMPKFKVVLRKIYLMREGFKKTRKGFRITEIIPKLVFILMKNIFNNKKKNIGWERNMFII